MSKFPGFTFRYVNKSTITIFLAKDCSQSPAFTHSYKHFFLHFYLILYFPPHAHLYFFKNILRTVRLLFLIYFPSKTDFSHSIRNL